MGSWKSNWTVAHWNLRRKASYTAVKQKHSSEKGVLAYVLHPAEWQEHALPLQLLDTVWSLAEYGKHLDAVSSESAHHMAIEPETTL